MRSAASEPRPRAKIGLACAGGVVEGAFYEVGVLCALEEAVEGLDLNRLDAYVGVSAGALIVASLANGITPRGLSRAIVGQSEEPELNLQPDILFRPAYARQARRLARLPAVLAGSILNYLRAPAKNSVLGALSGLGEAIPLSLLDNTPFETYLARAFTTGGRSNDFRDLTTNLRIVAVNLDTAELIAFGDWPTAHVPISKAVQASAALPILFPPVEIDGEYYIDGVARRTLNASQALEAGVELLFCINPIVPLNLRVAGEGPPLRHSLVEHGLPAVVSQMFRTLVHSRMQTGFRDYQHSYPEADLLLIEPEPRDHSMFFTNIFSFANRHDVCEHAYQSTRRFLLREAERIRPVLEKHGLRMRMDILLEPGRTLFAEDLPEEAAEQAFALAPAGSDALDGVEGELD